MQNQVDIALPSLESWQAVSMSQTSGINTPFVRRLAAEVNIIV